MGKRSASSLVSLFADAATGRSGRRTPPTRMRMRSKWTDSASLYRRLSALGGCDGASVAHTLNQWLSEGKTLSKFDIIAFVSQLRRYKQFHHALHLLEWMEDRGNDFTYSDHAIRIDLLSKAKGIAAAEEYFFTLAEPAKNKFTYGSLLNCYCKEKMLEKAMPLFKKMKELNFASTALAYNNLMSLYLKLDQPNRVPPLIQELKANNISPNVHTYNLMMHSYASLKDIEGVERVMEEIKAGGSNRLHWTQYSNLASIYIKAGHYEKAELTLKELEKINSVQDCTVFHHLISLYASISNSVEVNRVWRSLKLAYPKTTNMSYLTVLHALAKLDDIDGMKKCFKEWESSCTSCDIRVTNVLMDAFIKCGRIEEAESLLESAIQRGCIPNFRTLEMFLGFYLRNHEMQISSKLFEDFCLEGGG